MGRVKDLIISHYESKEQGPTPDRVYADILFNHPAFQGVLDELYDAAVYAPDYSYFMSAVRATLAGPLTLGNEIDFELIAIEIWEDVEDEREDMRAVRNDRLRIG